MKCQILKNNSELNTLTLLFLATLYFEKLIVIN